MANKNKDKQYCKQLYQEHYHDVFMFVQKRVQDEQKTVDIVREVFLQAFEDISINQSTVVETLTHLHKIASIKCEIHIASTSSTRYVYMPDEISHNVIDQMGTVRHRKTTIQKFKDVIKSLSIKEIQLLELRFSERKTFRDGGYILKISEQMVKLKTYRLLGKLNHLVNS